MLEYDEPLSNFAFKFNLRRYSKAPKSAGMAGDGGVGESVAAAAVRHDCHRDAVLSLAVVGVGMQRMLVTSGRDTAVKVWK